jgi:hypothetical protein
MAVLDLTIEFRKYTDHAKLVAAISPSFGLVTGDSLNITVVFSGSMVHSDSLLIVASLINHLRSLSVKVEVYIDGVDTYASRIDFYKLIDVPFEEQFPRKNSSGRFIELKKFDADTIYSLQDELNMILYQNRGIAKEVLELLFYCLGEVMDNTLVHSGLNSGWVSAQFYPRKEEIMLTICDYGQGIHHSLTTQPDTKYKDVSEPEALDLCIQRGVTNGKGLGFGLFATSQFILKNLGDLLLYSGNYYLTAKNGEYEVREGSYWNGTIVSLRINTNIPVDYKSIMPAHHTLPDDYQFFVDKFFGEENELW